MKIVAPSSGSFSAITGEPGIFALLAKQVGTYDEAELCKLLLEISLLDSAYQRSTAVREDVLMDVAKRYRVDAEKLQKAVAAEFAEKRDKKPKASPTSE